MDYQFATLSTIESSSLRKLETQINSKSGRQVILIAYEPGPVPTPVFDDRQLSGSPKLKQNIFASKDMLYGNITQWHI